MGVDDKEVLDKEESSLAKLHPALDWMLSSSLPTSFIRGRSPSLTPDEAVANIRDPTKFIKQLVRLFFLALGAGIFWGKFVDKTFL